MTNIPDYTINPFESHAMARTRVGVLGCPEARERESLWWSASLRKLIRPCEMSLGHLMNSLRMLVREASGGCATLSRPPFALDALVRTRPGGELLLEEWARRTHPYTPHWSVGHVPFEREWWEQRRLHGLVERDKEDR